MSTLPLRTTYYFGEEASAPGGDPTNRNSLLMASYTDSLQLSYREGLRRGPAFTPAADPHTDATPGSPAWHAQDATAAMVAALRPDPTMPLYVCGEAFSRFQGWVEGAFDTAETLLQQHLGLAPPAFAPHWQPPSGGRH